MTYEFKGHKYKIYQQGNKVIAVSTYAGRIVKGYARCAPEDVFDMERGKELAAARCAKKIEVKRLASIENQVDYYERMLRTFEQRQVKAREARVVCVNTLAELENDVGKF